MRQVLVDHARASKRTKRGGGNLKVAIDDTDIASQPRLEDVLVLDEALRGLEAIDKRKLRVVELRVFAGLNNKDIAAVLEISVNTVMRDWNFGKAWLTRELRE
jgi:RNA polymerase sigma factor (TIGR02999 family)